MPDNYGNNYAKMVAKAWLDEEFKAELKRDPKAVMKRMGIPVADDLHVEVFENTPTNFYWVLPAKPPDTIIDEDIDAMTSKLMLNSSCGNSVCESGSSTCMSSCGSSR
jgi:Nitrile hydratase, alpha chain